MTGASRTHAPEGPHCNRNDSPPAPVRERTASGLSAPYRIMTASAPSIARSAS